MIKMDNQQNNSKKIGMEKGRKICKKYLSERPKLMEHSIKVAKLCKKLAQEIIIKNPEFENVLEPEILGFLGYVHNIGTFIRRNRHELHTIYLLTNKENIPEKVAVRTRHGQLVEDYEEKKEDYYPIGLEGIILTYADIIVREDDELLPMEKRLDEMEDLMKKKKSVFGDYNSKMIENFRKAKKRYLRYEKIIHVLTEK